MVSTTATRFWLAQEAGLPDCRVAFSVQVTQQFDTCFAGPSDALLNASVAIQQGDFDSGDVCANEADAYIFAQNTCNDTASSVTLSVTVSHSRTN